MIKVADSDQTHCQYNFNSIFVMLKIQKFLNLTRHLFTKLHIKPNLPLIRPPLTSLLLPATCWFGINLLSMDLLEIKKRNSLQSVVNNVTSSIDKENENVNDLIIQITDDIKEGNLDHAKLNLQKAIQISEQTKCYEQLPHLYDLLSAVAIREGNTLEAEGILVRSIEKLSEIGFRETDNEIIRFMLMLSRLYQSTGDNEMARIGFCNSIVSLEKKFETFDSLDEITKMLYLSLIFWYSVFLADQNDLSEAKIYMKKTLDLSKYCSSLQPEQIVVVLYNLAELTFGLKVKFF